MLTLNSLQIEIVILIDYITNKLRLGKPVKSEYRQTVSRAIKIKIGYIKRHPVNDSGRENFISYIYHALDIVNN